MEKYTSFSANVNSFPQITLDLAFALNINPGVKRLFLRERNQTISHKYFKTKCYQDSCKEFINVCLASDPQMYNPNFVKPRLRDKEYKWGEEVLKERSFSDKELKNIAKFLYGKQSTFCFEREEGGFAFCASRVRGSARYAHEMRQKMIECTDYICSGNRQTYFLTVTCDPSKYKHRFDAWQNYKEKDMKPFLENLRKHYDCKYVAVLESTKKGYPHAHLVLSFPQGTFKNWDSFKAGQKLVFGKLINLIKGKGISRNFDLRVAKGKKVSHYLCKYISKGSEVKLKDLAEKKDALSTEERKLLLGLFCPSCAKRRSMFMTKIVKPSATAPDPKQGESFETWYYREVTSFFRSLYNGQVGDEELARLRAFLVKYVLSRPLSCSLYRGFCSQSRWDNEICEKPITISKSSVEIKENVRKKFSRASCKGCFWSDLQKWIIEPESSPLKYLADDIESRPDMPFDLSHVSNLRLLNWFCNFWSILDNGLYAFYCKKNSYQEYIVQVERFEKSKEK